MNPTVLSTVKHLVNTNLGGFFESIISQNLSECPVCFTGFPAAAAVAAHFEEHHWSTALCVNGLYIVSCFCDVKLVPSTSFHYHCPFCNDKNSISIGKQGLGIHMALYHSISPCNIMIEIDPSDRFCTYIEDQTFTFRQRLYGLQQLDCNFHKRNEAALNSNKRPLLGTSSGTSRKRQKLYKSVSDFENDSLQDITDSDGFKSINGGTSSSNENIKVDEKQKTGSSIFGQPKEEETKTLNQHEQELLKLYKARLAKSSTETSQASQQSEYFLSHFS